MSYIFVDVDGVLSPEQLRSGGTPVVEMGFVLNLHPVYGEWLLSLAEETNSELVWGTSWQADANRCVGTHLGLPELPHLDLTFRKFSETMEPVKARAAEEYANGEKFVYFDDWPIGMFLKGTNGLHIEINPYHGLMKRHLIEAAKHLNGL